MKIKAKNGRRGINKALGDWEKNKKQIESIVALMDIGHSR